LAKAEEEARKLGLPCLVVTFDRDPDELFLPLDRQRKLLSNFERLALLSGHAGQREVLALPFDRQTAQLTAGEFLEWLRSDFCHPQVIHVGQDFRFGAKAAGDVQLLQEWGAKQGCQVRAHSLLDDAGIPVTASRIRDCLANGQLEEANHLLTRPHHLFGQVVHGRGIGKGLGFPTANINSDTGVMLPAEGVYAGRVHILDDGVAKGVAKGRYDCQLSCVSSDAIPAAISVGKPLTFAGVSATVEATLLDFNDDIYAATVVVEFLRYLRPMQAFANPTELSDQITRDVQQVRESF
jgi:riboflavin kinase/FMN adenylyltransferase